MAPNISRLYRDNQSVVVSAVSITLALWYFNSKSKKKRSKPNADDIQYIITEQSPKDKVKAHVDGRFAKELRQLLKIGIPGVFTAETGFLVLVAASLVARSLCDLWMIQNGTKVESAIVELNPELFKRRLIKFFAAMPFISVVNNIMKWSIGELKLRLRNNITRKLYDEYLTSFTYYRMSNLDNRIANADQLLTNDVDKFCESVADLYSNVSKPILDISIYVYRLTMTMGGQTPGLMLGYLLVSGVILTHLRRPIGGMTVEEQKLEGQFRHINSRLITHSEEVAFYQGNNREKLTLLSSFGKLMEHLRRFLDFKVMMGIIDNIVAKYIATVVGFYAVSRPFLTEGHKLTTETNNERFRLYYTYGRMLVKLAEAIGRLVLAGRELTRLAGFTARVTQLRNVLKDLNEGRYVRTMLQNGDAPLIPGAGKIICQDNVISFDRVPLVTPNGDVLIDELTFEVKSGMNVLVCGPNGCGKSSLFRILGELWPIFGGTLTKPGPGKLFYIPQRPYMTLGTLRDQLIYPHTHADMKKRACDDAQLLKYLDLVQLTYLVERERGLDAVADWLDVLSGGEKQRIAMARLFYHSPQFAILDECTSAVSVDVEGSMYQYCREVGITLFTVSHRKSLWKHHDYYLQMDGHGTYKFEPINNDTQEFGS